MDTVSRTMPSDRGTGDLLLLTGPMFAGKSAALIAHADAVRAGRSLDTCSQDAALPDASSVGASSAGASWPGRTAGAGRAVLALKPAFDVRDGAASLCSRDGTRMEALPVSRWPGQASAFGTVVIDEVQFMVAPHYAGDIVEDVLAAVRSGQSVVAGGLDTDYARRPFEPVARLAERADRHLRLLARCHVCDAPAAWTAKRAETGLRLELGSEGLYEARCDAHWSLPASAPLSARASAPASAPGSVRASARADAEAGAGTGAVAGADAEAGAGAGAGAGIGMRAVRVGP